MKFDMLDAINDLKDQFGEDCLIKIKPFNDDFEITLTVFKNKTVHSIRLLDKILIDFIINSVS